MIRALFFDVDGTLVSFATHRVPDSTREALAAAHRRGVRIFIATGRASGDLGLIAGIPRDGVVALNGAECRLSDGECIACRPIPQADFERSMELAEELGFAVALEFDDGIFVDRVTPEVVRMAHSIAHPVPEAVDLRALFARRTCCQMCFFCNEETQRRIMPQLPGLAANRWCPIFTDINACGTDKAQGVAAMAARFGLAADEIMAFGDGGNDIPMLRAAGVGVAMGEAGPEVQAAADYVTDSVDDGGIRKALIRFGVIGSEN